MSIIDTLKFLDTMFKNKSLTPLTVNLFYYFHWLVLFYTLYFYFDSSGLIFTAISYFLFGCLGVEINAHRYFAHRSFKYKFKWMEYVFSWFTCLAGTGSPMQWAGIHFDHHSHSDEEGDPHNPRERGLWMLVWLVYAKGNAFNLKHMLNPYQKWLHRNYFLVYFITWSVLWVLGGFWLIAYAAIIPTILVTFVQVGTTYLCHMNIGYRNYKIKDESTNIWWWAILDFGEGLHNNHHADPGRWNLKDKWFEIDISGLVIKYFLKNETPPSRTI